MSAGEPSLNLSQQLLWDMQHAQRGTAQGLEGDVLVNSPNELAVLLGSSLVKGSHIIEIGSANGRDARYWASHDEHFVRALDFSQVALDQLNTLAAQQGVDTRISTSLFDANQDPLPVGEAVYDAFYARSALHVTADRLTYLLHAVNGALGKGGLVAIEGKHVNDPKIKRSVALNPADPFLVHDPYENGHVRRVWEPAFAREVLSAAGFGISEIEVIDDVTVPGDPSIFTRIIAVKE